MFSAWQAYGFAGLDEKRCDELITTGKVKAPLFCPMLNIYTGLEKECFVDKMLVDREYDDGGWLGSKNSYISCNVRRFLVKVLRSFQQRPKPGLIRSEFLRVHLEEVTLQHTDCGVFHCNGTGRRCEKVRIANHHQQLLGVRFL